MVRDRKTADLAAHMWARTGGQSWMPKNPQAAACEALVAAGWVRRGDGRCGFEAFKDVFLIWTDSARAALEKEAA